MLSSPLWEGTPWPRLEQSASRSTCVCRRATRRSKISGASCDKLPSATAGTSSTSSPTTASRVPRSKDRPGLDALLKAVARREVDMVAAWSVDRLGRSLKNLIEVLSELHAKGVDLYLHQQGLDTSTPSGRAMFQMMGVFAEFERAMIRERVLAGLARAKEQGTALGRPHLEDSDPHKVTAVKAALAAGKGLRRIARELSVGVCTVYRIRAATAQPHAA